jgi:hypothetical protein
VVALVNLYTFSSKAKKIPFIRPLAITLSLLSIYQMLIFSKLVKPNEGIHQWQINFIKIQKYAYQEYSNLKIVLVGSSLTVRLPTDEIGSQVLNLGMSGGCAQTGIEAVQRTPAKPAILLVEINETIIRKIDSQTIDSIYSPFLYYTRLYFPVLRQEYQPLSILISALTSLKYKVTHNSRIVHQQNKSNQIVNLEPSLTEKLIAQKIEGNKVPLVENEKKLFIQEAAVIKSKITEIKKDKVRVILFDVPTEQRVRNTVRQKQIRALTSELFPKSKFEWMPEPPLKQWATYDGTHLIASDAKDYVAFIKEQLLSKQKAISEHANSQATVKSQ